MAPTTSQLATARTARSKQPKRAWLLITGLITLGLIPILANAIRRLALSLDIAGSAVEATPPLSLPVVLHILGASVFVILAAFQFSARLRRSRPAWHRNAGRVLVAVGLLAAFSGLWLGVISSWSGTGVLLLLFRLLAALGMALSIIVGFVAIRRKDIRRHRAWMIRAVAIGLGAGTQVFTLGFGEAFFGRTELSVALLNGAGWVINLAVAELAIRRGPRRRASTPAATAAALS
jgi:uncharacterized membrane protein